MKLNAKFFAGFVAASTLVLVGCDEKPMTYEGAPEGKILEKTPDRPKSDAGLGLSNPSAKLPTVQKIASGMSLASRNDPFKLLPTESAFDYSQKTERLIAEGGGYKSYFTPTQDTQAQPTRLEPRPLWRVAGVVVSENGVVALLDLGNRRTVVIRPGQRIEGSPFEVASIDSKQAVLRRTDGKQPMYVTIELSGPLASAGPLGFGAPQGGQQAGQQGGRPPGVPPQGAPRGGRGGDDIEER